jgi:hypothetical protein
VVSSRHSKRYTLSSPSSPSVVNNNVRSESVNIITATPSLNLLDERQHLYLYILDSCSPDYAPRLWSPSTQIHESASVPSPSHTSLERINSLQHHIDTIRRPVQRLRRPHQLRTRCPIWTRVVKIASSKRAARRRHRICIRVE